MRPVLDVSVSSQQSATPSEASASFLPSWVPEVGGTAVPPGLLLPATHQGEADRSPLADGEVIAGFRILQLLGRGSFAEVYLAEQISLSRLVALKISSKFCFEAQVLARLEHEHIVRVLSEFLDRASGRQVVCMQYIPGIALSDIIARLWQSSGEWQGRDLLQAASEGFAERTSQQAISSAKNVLPESANRFQTVCWLGAKLADALAHAHTKGVLHRDIKPANILVDHYGHPYLADFNLSIESHRQSVLNDRIGGTVAYMAPEHLLAFDRESEMPAEHVDGRSDLFSLGVVLLELACGRRPWTSCKDEGDQPRRLQSLAAERGRALTTIRELCPEMPLALEHIIRRCLAPNPRDRFQSALELAKSLQGALQVLTIQEHLSPKKTCSRLLARFPFWTLIVLVLFPQLLGSLTNIAYNSTQIVSQLSPAQREMFRWMVLWYNAVAYPAAFVQIWRLFRPVSDAWSRLDKGAAWPMGEMERIRQSILRWPHWSIGLSCAGWLPGILIFPLAVSWQTESLAGTVWLHFLASFGISWLISLTYTFLGVQFVIIELLYPWLWRETWSLHSTAQVELARTGFLLRGFQWLAGIVPLAGAFLLLMARPTEAMTVYRTLIGGLIISGSIGFTAGMLIVNRLQHRLSLILQSP